MTHDYAVQLLKSYTAGLTPEQLAAAANRMVAHGECAWHAAATVCNRRCNCFDCSREAR